MIALALLGCTQLEPDRPDIVVVAFEGLRADVASELPVFRDLADESVVYPRAVTPSPWGLSALASLLTGVAPSEHKVVRHPIAARQYGTLAAWDTTLPQELADKGYRTAVFGQSVWLDPMFGLDRGFDVLDRHSVESPTERVVEEAVEYLGAAEQPAFVLIVLPEPTFPWDSDRCDRGGLRPLSREEYVGAFDGEPIGRERQREIRQLYLAEACGAEAVLGDLLAELVDRHWLVVTSLHGFELWDPGAFGFGTSLKPASVHVPLLVRGPGLVPRSEGGSLDLRALRSFLLQPSQATLPAPGPQSLGVSMAPPRTLDRTAIYGEDELLVAIAETGMVERWQVRPDGSLGPLQGVGTLRDQSDPMAQALHELRDMEPLYPDTSHSVWRVDGELLREISLVGGRRPAR